MTMSTARIILASLAILLSGIMIIAGYNALTPPGICGGDTGCPVEGVYEEWLIDNIYPIPALIVTFMAADGLTGDSQRRVSIPLLSLTCLLVFAYYATLFWVNGIVMHAGRDVFFPDAVTGETAIAQMPFNRLVNAIQTLAIMAAGIFFVRRGEAA